MKVLSIDRPNQREVSVPWNDETKRKYELTADDCEVLEEGRVLFADNGDALSLEEEES